LLDVFLVCYNSEGKFMYGHAMPTIVLNDNALYWNDLCNIESETDQINVQPGQAYLDGTNSEFVIRELPTMPKSGRGVSLTEYILYTIKNNTPSEGTLLQEHNPDVKIITQRSN
jgi:hypothetical protein